MTYKQFPWVSIIILNYNSWRDTITCLESVLNIDYQNYFVVVMDNGSTDNSIEYLRKWATGGLEYTVIFPDHPDLKGLYEIRKPIKFSEYDRKEFFINEKSHDLLCEEIFIPKSTISKSKELKLILIDNKINLGYAGGNNVGIRYSMKYLNAEYVMILNNDTVVASNLLKKLIEVFFLIEDTGLCGPLEYSYQSPFNIQFAGGQFRIYSGMHKMLTEPTAGIKAVDWVCGSCMLIKKDLIRKIGLIDERYFLYNEEIDYAYRVKKSGYAVYLSSETSIWHKGGKNDSDLFYYYSYRNRLLFALKHLNIYQLMIFIPIHFVKWFLFRSIKDLIKNNRINFSEKLYAIRDAFEAYNKGIKNYGNID